MHVHVHDCAQAETVEGCINAVFCLYDQEEEDVETGSEAAVDPADIPGWTLEKWLAGLPFDAIVSNAVLKRVHERTPPGMSTAKYEKRFVTMLGKNCTTDVVLALLRETPVLNQACRRPATAGA